MPLVVLWLLVAQRLQGGASMESAVLEMLCGLPASFWPRPCKRIRDWHERGKTPSSNTGPVIRHGWLCRFRLWKKAAIEFFNNSSPNWIRRQRTLHRAFSFWMVRRCARRTLPTRVKSILRDRTDTGSRHWPLLRILVAHDLQTGLAMSPEWGAVHGEEAVSEQGLLERAIDRLPQNHLEQVHDRIIADPPRLSLTAENAARYRNRRSDPNQ
jgi:hypothetical protein